MYLVKDLNQLLATCKDFLGLQRSKKNHHGEEVVRALRDCNSLLGFLNEFACLL